jgi:hypothetical protein
MLKRRQSGAPRNASRKPPEPPARPKIVHTSLYLPEGVHEALREIAFHERAKIHDLIVEGIALVLRKRGYPSMEDLKAGNRRQPRRGN